MLVSNLVCIYASLQPCLIYGSLQPCIYASLQPCIYASLQPCLMYGSLQPCIYASLQRCIYGSIQSCIYGSSPTVVLFLQTALDYLGHLSIQQIRKLYQILATLAFSNLDHTSSLQNEIHTFIRKQLHHFEPRCANTCVG